VAVDPDLTFREIRASRDAHIAAWEAGRYPAAAYETVRLLEASMEAPEGYAEDWPKYVAMSVHDAVTEDDDRDAQTIADLVRPRLSTPEGSRMSSFGAALADVLKPGSRRLSETIARDTKRKLIRTTNFDAIRGDLSAAAMPRAAIKPIARPSSSPRP
jgi:hypothetical protein